MVVKVQISLFTTAAAPQVLVYNEDRSVEWTGFAGQNVIDLMGDRNKAFFEASVRPNGTIDILAEAEWQGW